MAGRGTWYRIFTDQNTEPIMCAYIIHVLPKKIVLAFLCLRDIVYS